MALTQVRAKLGEEWVILTLNPATGRYEGELTAGGTSIHQEGGYCPVTVEVANDTGKTDTLSGDTYAPLRLVVREMVRPALTLISPQPGWLTTDSPALVFDAVDEEGGSGVDPESFSVSVGPAPLDRPTGTERTLEDDPPPSAGPTWEAIPNGFRFRWMPPEPWADGPHLVTASVADRDGNTAMVSAAYTVDTVPPALFLRKPDSHRVVDVDRIQISGWARDETSGVAGVTVSPSPDGPAEGGGPRAAQGDRPYMEFSVDVPLTIGENTITVTAADNAGLTATQTVWVLRLVTDRTKADVARLQALYARGIDNWTEEDLNWFNAALCLRGSYDAGDLNRVGVAVEYLTRWLKKAGYLPVTQPKTDWTAQDVVTNSQGNQYLQNVESIRAQMPVWYPETPGTLRRSGIEDWNNIEKILVSVDSFRPRLEYSAWQSGNLQCGALG